MNKLVPILAAGLSLGAAISPASAAILFTDDFDSGFSSIFWNTNRSGGDSVADFNFDYSALGIPSAPHSLVPGTSIGMRFLVNQSAGVFQGISASPTAQSFPRTDDFVLHFDMWMNFVGPFPLGGSGTTQSSSFGWGTSGFSTQWAGAKNSVLFGATLDGGSAQDYRAYLTELAPAVGAPISPTSGVYAAGTTLAPDPDARNNDQPYYAGFGGVAAPAAQIALYGSQTGTTAVGSIGMSWHEVSILKSGEEVSWFVDNLRIATVPITGATLGGDNIFFGMFDTNNGSSTDPNDFLNTVIYDNITVESIPEPATAALIGIASAAVGLRRRRR
jgi:hypothetical protein